MAVRTHGAGLNHETRSLLAHLRKNRPENRVLGQKPEVVKAQAHTMVSRILAASRLRLADSNQYVWFAQDVAAALSVGQGEMLAYELEAVLHRWLVFGLEPKTVQLLLRVLLRDVAGIDVEPEAAHGKPETADTG